MNQLQTSIESLKERQVNFKNRNFKQNQNKENFPNPPAFYLSKILE